MTNPPDYIEYQGKTIPKHPGSFGTYILNFNENEYVCFKVWCEPQRIGLGIEEPKVWLGEKWLAHRVFMSGNGRLKALEAKSQEGLNRCKNKLAIKVNKYIIKINK